MFRLSAFLLNSMSKLIHYRCTCKVLIKTLLFTSLYANEQLRVGFYVLIRYSLLFSSEIILKQLSASGSVNIVDFVSGIIRHYNPSNLFTRARLV